MPRDGTRQLLLRINRLLKEVATIIMGNSNLHSSRRLEVLGPLLTIPVLMVTLSQQLLDTVKAKVIPRMDMGDIMHLLNLVMVRPNQMQLGVTINKVIILQLVMAMYPTLQGMARHLPMELKVMLARLHLNKDMLQVSSPAQILITLHKHQPILGMVYRQLPKAVM
jgi:hypothetical protein